MAIREMAVEEHSRNDAISHNIGPLVAVTGGLTTCESPLAILGW